MRSFFTLALVLACAGLAFGQASAPGDFINSAPLLGANPLYITIDDSDVLYVGGLSDGTAYTYDLALANLGSIPSPFNSITGIAWDGNALQWIDGLNGMLATTDTTGVLLGSVEPLPLPAGVGGLVFGLTYNATTGTLWANAPVQDIYYEFSLPPGSGTTGAIFCHPDGSGEGIGISSIANGLFVIPSGPGGAADQVDSVHLMEAGGATIDEYSTVLSVPDSSITGVVHHPTGSGMGPGGGVDYLVGLATNTIYEVQSFEVCSFDQISGFSTTFDDTTVTGTYTEPVVYDEVEVTRDGVAIAVQPSPGDGTFSDTPPLPVPVTGYSYAIASTIAGETCAGGSDVVVDACSIVVTHIGSSPLGITIDEGDGVVYVQDLFSGNTTLYDKDLVFITTIASPGGLGSTMTGIAHNPVDDTIYWVDESDGILWQTDDMGVVVGASTLANPGGGFQAGMCLSPASAPGDLVIVDRDAEAYYAINFDGSDAGAIFTHLDGGGFGLGIAKVDSTDQGGGTDFDGFDVPHGSVADGEVVAITLVDIGGNPLGCEIGTTVDDIINEFFVRGNQVSSTGGGIQCGNPVRYVVGSSKIYRQTFCPFFFDAVEFKRGDFNNDGTVNALVDALGLLNFGFVPGSPPPPCEVAADVNGDRVINALVDGLYLLNFGFVPGSPAPPAPGPDVCGPDANGVAALGCTTPGVICNP